jgi:hypothetical protein
MSLIGSIIVNSDYIELNNKKEWDQILKKIRKNGGRVFILHLVLRMKTRPPFFLPTRQFILEAN